MKIISPSFEILNLSDPDDMLKRLETYGRVCYKSESKITADSATSFIKAILEKGHESVIEHAIVTVKLICDRGVTHEIVRHRIASYSQESTRYCNYSKNMFGKELTFIKPFYWESDTPMYLIWVNQMKEIEESYMKLIELGATPEQARSVLPNSLKTEIVVTMNLREWRHFFRLRTSSNAHPQMREIIVPLYQEMSKRLPAIFTEL